jgi:hypothetical protein
MTSFRKGNRDRETSQAASNDNDMLQMSDNILPRDLRGRPTILSLVLGR